MKRRAFTLVEMLTVIAIAVLLLAILIPGLNSARSAARTAKCRSNLGQIAHLFVTAQCNRVQERSMNLPPFPAQSDWPREPQTLAANKEVFICPEDRNPVVGMALDRVEYCFGSGTFTWRFPLNLPNGPGVPYWSMRSDADPQGRLQPIQAQQGKQFTEYVIEDDWRSGLDLGPGIRWLSAPGCYDHSHDGTFRVYEDGTLVVVYCGCGDPNFLYYNGTPLWNDGRMRNHVSESTSLGGGGTASYGLNTFACQLRAGGSKVVVMDYVESLYADPDDPQTPTRLGKAARHTGRINVLASDHSVTGLTPVQISPVGSGAAKLWKPGVTP